MASRDEKLLLARKMLREYQGRIKDPENQSKGRTSQQSMSSSSSPGPSNLQSLEEGSTRRTESPLDNARVTWERRETLPISETQMIKNLQEQIRESEQSASMERTATQEAVHNEISQLHLQMQNQAQALNVLISERNEAHAALSRVQSELHHRTDALEDLKCKYMEAIRRVSELENLPTRHAGPLMQTNQAEAELREAQEVARQQMFQLQEQISELRSRLEAKDNECSQLASKVFNLENELSVAQVKIQQLTIEDSSPGVNHQEAELREKNGSLMKQVELLERRLQAAAMEGEQAAHRFHVYAEQCTSQQAALKTQLRELTDENFTLKEQRVALNLRVDELQSSFEQIRSQSNPLQTQVAFTATENESLLKRLQEKESEVAGLQSALAEAEKTISETLNELAAATEKAKRLENNADAGRPDPALLAVMESDKVAASRAVAQNNKLKDQLTELQEAIVRLSDEKLSLTEKLSTLQYEISELRKPAHDHSHGHECENGHDHDNGDHHDHHDHDHDHEHTDDDDTDMDEPTLRKIVAALKRDKAELVKRLQKLQGSYQQSEPNHVHHSSHQHDHNHKHDHDHRHDHGHDNDKEKEQVPHEKLEELERAVKQLQLDKAELLRRLGGPVEDAHAQGLLEAKLKKTMEEIAFLDEERQRLEHLVLQLQSETETIGEYIALYHKQRLLLRQRAVEKDEQVIQLSKDREELKGKLASLNELVARLVADHSNAVEAKESDGAPSEEMTADKIRALITEIGNNSVVNHSMGFEQCSGCSGRLLTV